MPDFDPLPLRRHLLDRIDGDGPLSFSAFMECALYEPGLGFYRRGDSPVGREGHFFTSVAVGALFGEILAGRIGRSWEALGAPREWVLAEQGALEGHLMADILDALERRHPAAAAGVRVVLFEPDDGLRRRQEAVLRSRAGTRDLLWRNGPEAAAGVWECGIFYSNELLDSFPFDRVVFRRGEWFERCVGRGEGGFGWIDRPCSPDQMREIERWQVPAIEGYQTELHPQVSTWAGAVYGLFRRGVVLTVDYGCSAGEYYAPHRTEGTARCYRHHRQGRDLLEEPGGWDLTCHVNFDLLREEGGRQGYSVAYDRDQHHFMVDEASRSGLLMEWENQLNRRPADADIQARIRQFKTLMHPEIMGRQFRVLIQERPA